VNHIYVCSMTIGTHILYFTYVRFPVIGSGLFLDTYFEIFSFTETQFLFKLLNCFFPLSFNKYTFQLTVFAHQGTIRFLVDYVFVTFFSHCARSLFSSHVSWTITVRCWLDKAVETGAAHAQLRFGLVRRCLAGRTAPAQWPAPWLPGPASPARSAP